MSDAIRTALEGVLQTAAQAESDARYEIEKELEREKRRAERFVNLEVAHVNAQEDLREAREALTKLGYAFDEPLVHVGVAAKNLTNEDLGL